MRLSSSLTLSILAGLVLRLPELGNLRLDSLLDPVAELGTVAEHEEEFQPDEHGRQEDGLEETLRKGRGTALKLAVADELGNPADDVDSSCDLRRGRWGDGEEVVAHGCPSKQDDCVDGAGNWLEEHVQATPGEGAQGAAIHGEIGDRGPLG